jgi:hypothetical protein
MCRAFVFLLVAVLLPVSALAKQSSTEHIRIGVVLNLLPGRIWFGEVALRVSLPMGDKAGVDLGVGKYLITGRLKPSGEPRYRVVSQFKWLHSGRNDDGLAGYLFGGPQLFFFTHGAKRMMVGYGLGYGLDWRATNGMHAGFAFEAGGVSEGPLVHIGGFLLAEPKK